MTQDNNIPQGYKRTEFGLIPQDWELCTFQDVLATFSSGATPYRGIPEYYNGDVRWISSGELNYNHIYDTLEHISQQAVRNTNLRIHKPGTFLMAITGLEAEGTRGRCAFVGAPSATNQSCLAINGTDKMCAEYLFWFYRMWGQYLAFKYCQGTKQQSYTADIVKKLPIYGPKDITEQRAIAEALSDVDGLIAALDKKIAKKRLLKQGAMQQLLTGKKRLPGFTDEWVDTPIGEGVRFQVGYPFQSQYFTSDRIGKRLVKNRDLKSDDQIVFYNGEYDYKFIVHNGDILIGMDGDFLPYKWDKGIALLNQRVGRLLPTKKWDLSGGYSNAMLVADSIYQACRYWEVFQSTELKGHCAVVTSYDASAASVKDEYQGDGETEDLTKYEIYQKMIGNQTAEQFEAWAKQEFIDHPGDMKLLIVVDKLLTGFDAPSATYLYIDKKMRDHNLFQAICRVNRVDSEEKDYGYIVDYQDLFGAVKSAIEDYTNGAFDGYDAEDIQGLLTNRLAEGRKALEEALQAVHTMCEVIHPQTREAYFAYFVYAETTPIDEQQAECDANANKRETFYKLVSRLVRRYIDLANEMEAAEYTAEEAADIKKQVDYYNDIKDEIKLKSGDALDLKYYDPAMRQLIDNYVRAEDSEKLVDLADISFLDLIDTDGDKAIDSLPKKIKQNERSMAEVLAANMRKMIISERPNNPAYFDKMSELLNQLLQEQKDGKLQYKELINKLIEKLKEARSTVRTKYPVSIDTKGKQALYDNLGNDEALSLCVHDTIKANARDGFRDMDSSGVKKMRALRRAVEKVLVDVKPDKLDDIMQLIVAQKEY